MLDETNYKIDENNSLLILDDDQPFLKRLSVAMEKRGFNVFLPVLWQTLVNYRK